MQVVAAASEADALATLGAYFDALSRALAVPVEGLRKRCLVRFELGAPGDAAGWVWEGAPTCIFVANVCFAMFFHQLS